MKSSVTNITKFYVWKFLEGFEFIYAIKIIYLVSIGITVSQLALFASITAVTSILFEIPTGFIADKFSRKLAISLGFLSQSLAFLVIAFVSNFYTLIPVAVLLGLGAAFISGSDVSLIFDELKTDRKGGDYLKVSSHGTSVKTVSGAIATFLGPLLFVVNHQLPFILTSIVYFVLALFVLTIKERKSSHEVQRVVRIFDGIKNVLQFKPILLIALIDALLLIFVNIFYNILYFPKITSLGFPILYLGVLDAINLILMTGMLTILPKLNFKKDKTAIVVYSLLAACVFIVFSNVYNLLPAVIFGVAFDLIWAARLHIIPTITNRFFASVDRAVSLSSISFVSKLGAALLLPITVAIFNISYWFTLVPLALVCLLLYKYPNYQKENNR